MSSAAAWVLRIALASCFFSHGVLALMVHEPWLGFFPAVGLDVSFGRAAMPLVGALDVAIAGVLLARPHPVVLAWCVFWTLFTATLRPLSGLGLGDLLVRAMNVGPAFALLLVDRRLSTFTVRASLVVSLAVTFLGAVLDGDLFPARLASVLGWTERAGLPAMFLALVLSPRGSSMVGVPDDHRGAGVPP